MFLKSRPYYKPQLFDDDTFYKASVKDLKRAKQRVIIESPFIATKRFSFIYPLLKKAARDKIETIINTRDPIEHELSMQTQALECVNLL